MNLQSLDAQGKTNSSAFLSLCQKYRAQRQRHSSNSGEIKSISDITGNLRDSICNSAEQSEQDMDALIRALEEY